MKCIENYVDGYSENFKKMGYNLDFIAKTSYPNNAEDYRIKDNSIICMNLTYKNRDKLGYYLTMEDTKRILEKIKNQYGVNNVEASIILKNQIKEMIKELENGNELSI